MKNLHDIIQKNMEEIKEEWPKYYAWFKASGMHQAPDMIRGIENFWLAKLSSSQLSIIQAIDEMIDEVIKKKEQVNGFQPYHTCDEECEVKCKRLRDERKIFFDGWDDGRNLMKIDLMRIRSFLNTKTKLQ